MSSDISALPGLFAGSKRLSGGSVSPVSSQKEEPSGQEPPQIVRPGVDLPRFVAWRSPSKISKNGEAKAEPETLLAAPVAEKEEL